MTQDERHLATLTIVVTRIEAKLDVALTQGMDHEARLRVLESDGYLLKGKVGMVSAFAGAAAGWLAQTAPTWFGQHKP